MTRNGLLSWLLGWLFVFAGLNALLGIAGLTALGIAMICLWVGRDTGLNRKAINWARSLTEGKQR